MNPILRKIKKDILLILTVCLAFSLMGGVVRDNTARAIFSPAEEIAAADSAEPSADLTSGETETSEPKRANLPPVEETESEEKNMPEDACYCNGSYIGSYKTEDDCLYVCVQSVLSALNPNSIFTRTEDCFEARCGEVKIEAEIGEYYFTSNQRYFYAPAGVLCEGSSVYLPAEYLVRCFGGSCQYDEENERLDIYAADITPLEDGDSFYNEDDLYWLSHIIYAEAGSESMKGKIAVGNVVINRVNSDSFPQDTIEGVIFAEGQFEPAALGTLYNTPSEASIVAAKLALEGCEVVPDYTTYFATACLGNAFTIVTWIGNHCFMTL